MAKPILLIICPKGFLNDQKNIDNITSAVKSATENEYHVLLLTENIYAVKIEVFNSDKIEPIEIERLTEIVTKRHKQNGTG